MPSGGCLIYIGGGLAAYFQSQTFFCLLHMIYGRCLFGDPFPSLWSVNVMTFQSSGPLHLIRFIFAYITPNCNEIYGNGEFYKVRGTGNR